MLFYNPIIRRKITYKLPVLFGEVQVEKKVLYSYSIFTNEFKEREIVFDERKINIYEYKPEINFIETLTVYDENNKMIKKLFFDIVEKKNSIIVHSPDPIIIEFKESSSKGDRYGNGMHSYIVTKNDSQGVFYILYSNKINSLLGIKVKVKLFKNTEGDFIREEFYDSKNDTLQFVLENEYEYFESGIEKRAQSILRNGWNC
jgi:hypothetical protein